MGVTTPKPPAQPKPPVKPQEIKRVAEKGTFYPNTTVAIKHTPTIKAKQEATLGKGSQLSMIAMLNQMVMFGYHTSEITVSEVMRVLVTLKQVKRSVLLNKTKP